MCTYRCVFGADIDGIDKVADFIDGPGGEASAGFGAEALTRITTI